MKLIDKKKAYKHNGEDVTVKEIEIISNKIFCCVMDKEGNLKEEDSDELEMTKYELITRETLKECKERIRAHLQEVANRYWKIGEELEKAKKAIIRDTGDNRAPGFKKWVNGNFPFSYETAKRMMRAWRMGLTEPEDVWYDRNKKERKKKKSQGRISYPETSENLPPEPKEEKPQPKDEFERQVEAIFPEDEDKEVEIIEPGEKKEREIPWFQIQVTLDTSNMEVVNFLRGLSKMQDTEVIFYREFDVENMMPPNTCIACEKEISWKSKTGMCPECYIKYVLKKHPDIDSALTLSERIMEVQQVKKPAQKGGN